MPVPSRPCLCAGHGGPGLRAEGKQRLGAGALGMCGLSVGALRASASGSAPGACPVLSKREPSTRGREHRLRLNRNPRVPPALLLTDAHSRGRRSCHPRRNGPESPSVLITCVLVGPD